ncbi:MAG TPA: phosphodiesterase [Clostridiaceae bacterium]
MKIMVASDIHGSAYYCEKLVNVYKEEKADKLLLLGDILYHGPRNDLPKEYDPKKVIAMLNEIGSEILCVRGNCEAEVDQQVLQFPIMADYCILYIEKHMIFATHGHKFNEETPPLLKKGDILLNGHTHVPKLKEHEDYIYMNPGSVSIPKAGSKSGYMLICNNKFMWKDFDGNCFKRFEL